MPEETESIRQDNAVRQVEGKEKLSFNGKRVRLPKGVTVPTNPEDGEMFIHEYSGQQGKLIFFDDEVNNWVTVGP